VEREPLALKDLERLGIPLVPAVVLQDRVVHGWNPRAVAELAGVEYAETEPLPPQELSQLLDRILVAAQCAIRQIPSQQLDVKSQVRDRSVAQLGYHIFRLSLAFRDGMEQGQYPEDWLLEEAPTALRNGTALVDYGEHVRRSLAKWWPDSQAYHGVVHTYYGPQTAGELLERTVWHAAQHLRQLYALLELMGLEPSNPLTEADFRGLPLPKEVW